MGFQESTKDLKKDKPRLKVKWADQLPVTAKEGSSLLGKSDDPPHLSQSIGDISRFLPPIQSASGLATQQQSPPWFIPELRKVLSTHQRTPSAPPFSFESSPESAAYNEDLFMQYGGDLDKLIKSHPDTTISYGSEFRKTEVLEPLLRRHPNWDRLRSILKNGSSWPITSIMNDDNRNKRNSELVKRGNHTSATKYAKELQCIIQTEVSNGWAVPIPISAISKIPGIEVAPLGIVHQYQSHEDGHRSDKFRSIHDQSFGEDSINSRIDRDSLAELLYGFCLTRIIHYIVGLRFRLPRTKILISKTDIKAAYRRIHSKGDTALRCVVFHDGLAFVSLRLTFGGTPCPSEFCTASELCADLANDILHDSSWDPFELQSPHAAFQPKYQGENEPFVQALELDVELPVDNMGLVDVFIDDGITIVPDIGDNMIRGAGAMPLAIHTLFRPLAEDEPLRRDDPLSLSKLKEEGAPSETQIVLGWLINTRSLSIALPADKFSSWLGDLQNIISTGKASVQSLEQLIGRLNHTATVLPLARYYLVRLRNTVYYFQSKSDNKTADHNLRKSVLEDLRLFSDCFLPKVSSGVNMNIITFRRPTHIFWSDACPQGMGGYSATSGKAWRITIPEEFRNCISNNVLELSACIISVWIAILENDVPALSCILALSDNTSAVGWLHRMNVEDESISGKHLQQLTRLFASLLISSDLCLYSQHFKGSFNNVADALSRRNDLSDIDLTSFIRLHFSAQVPPTFRIEAVPQSIISWNFSLIQKTKEAMASPNQPWIKKTGLGEDGCRSVNSSRTKEISSSVDWKQMTEQECSPPLRQLFDEETFVNQVKEAWVQAQLKRPSQKWVRCFGRTWGTTHIEQKRVQSIHC